MQSSSKRVLSPTECLPVELLVPILLESKAPKIDRDNGPFDDTVEECQRPVTNWVPLMLVSRRFRDVILSAPTMWSRIPITNNLDALRHRLFRSGESTIDLLLSGSCQPALPQILPHASRIRSIITLPRFGFRSLRSLLPLFHVRLTALEEVYIVPKITGPDAHDHWAGLKEIGPVLNEIFQPQVRKLSAYRDLLPTTESTLWTLQLRHLDMRCQEKLVTVELRNDILDVLRATPHLESLAIIFPEAASPPDHLCGVVHDKHSRLPSKRHLRAVKLSGPVWFCGAVLHGFDMPSLDRLSINTTAIHEDEPNAAIVDMFPDRLCRLLAQHTRLHVHALSNQRGYRLGDCLCETGQISSDRLYLRVHAVAESNGVELASPLGLLCRAFSDAPLEAFEVNYFVSPLLVTNHRWRKVLETFPGLRRLTLRGNGQKAGAAMVRDIEALQREGLNPNMELIADNTDW